MSTGSHFCLPTFVPTLGNTKPIQIEQVINVVFILKIDYHNYETDLAYLFTQLV